jgi:hypothetical protein
MSTLGVSPQPSTPLSQMDRVRAHVGRLNGQQSQANLPQVGLASLAQSPAQPAAEDAPLFAAQPSNSNLLFADEVDAHTPNTTAAQSSQPLINSDEQAKILEAGTQLFNKLGELPQQPWGIHQPEAGNVSVITAQNYVEQLKGKLERGEATPEQRQDYHLLSRLNFGKYLRTGISEEVFLTTLENKINRTTENHALGQYVESSWVALADTYATSDAVMVAQNAP